MIQLKPVKLQRRKVCASPGPQMDFGRVLIICQLDPDKLYSAAMAAATGYDPKSQPKEYLNARVMILDFGKRNEITSFPDNVDENGALINLKGKRILKGAMWTGAHWQEKISDVLWNKACDVFDEVDRLLQDAKTEDQLDVDIWYDEIRETIIQLPSKTTSHSLATGHIDDIGPCKEAEVTDLVSSPKSNQIEPCTGPIIDRKRQSSGSSFRWTRPGMKAVPFVAILIISICLWPLSGQWIEFLSISEPDQVETIQSTNTFFLRRYNKKKELIFPFKENLPGWDRCAVTWQADEGIQPPIKLPVSLLAFSMSRAHQQAPRRQSEQYSQDQFLLIEQSLW